MLTIFFQRFEQLPAWASIVLAFFLGSLTGAGILALGQRLAPGSNPILAFSDMVTSGLNGQMLVMSHAFDADLSAQRQSGLYGISADRADLRLVFAARGNSFSYARVPNEALEPCLIDMAIDGNGSPSLHMSAFSSYVGAAPRGSDPTLSSSKALAASFTLAHELGHCMFGSSGSATAALALARASGNSGAERVEAALAFVKTPFGKAMMDEGLADAMAIMSLSRRLSARDLSEASRLIIERRREVTQAFANINRLSDEDAHHTQYALRELLTREPAALATVRGQQALDLAVASAAEGVATFFHARPDALASSKIDPALGQALREVGHASCSKTYRPKTPDCADL